MPRKPKQPTEPPVIGQYRQYITAPPLMESPEMDRVAAALLDAELTRRAIARAKFWARQPEGTPYGGYWIEEE